MFIFCLITAKTIRKQDLIERELRTTIQKEQQINEQLASNRLILCDEIKTTQIQLDNKSNEFLYLQRQREQDMVNLHSIEQKLEFMQKTNASLQSALDLKETQYDELRSNTTSQIESLRQVCDFLCVIVNRVVFYR